MHADGILLPSTRTHKGNHAFEPARPYFLSTVPRSARYRRLVLSTGFPRRPGGSTSSVSPNLSDSLFLGSGQHQAGGHTQCDSADTADDACEASMTRGLPESANMSFVMQLVASGRKLKHQSAAFIESASLTTRPWVTERRPGEG